MSELINLGESNRGNLNFAFIGSLKSSFSPFNKSQNSQRNSKQSLKKKQSSQSDQTPQNTNFSKNYLRFMTDLTKQYILTNQSAIQFQMSWLKDHKQQLPKQKSQAKLYRQFISWVHEKSQKLNSAKQFREILSKKGHFETLYRTICFKFYEEEARVYIINHQLKKNQNNKGKQQVEHSLKHRVFALKNLWKMQWIIKNCRDFKGIKKIP